MAQVQTPTTSFVEPARTLPVLAHADVLVLGGGPGGVGAALSAARNGARTIIVDRFGSFGGTWTSGLLSSIMPFPFVKGIFHEIIEELDKAGGWRRSETEDPYDTSAPTSASAYGHGGIYCGETLKNILDRMMLEAGVTPYFFVQIVSVFREDDRITGVVVESKEGRFVLTADIFIDASGDGDVCHLAGVPTSYGRNEDSSVQPMTMVFKMDGVEDARTEAYCQEDLRLAKKWQAAKKAGEVTVPRENILLSRSPVPGQWVFNSTRILGKNGTLIKDVTEAMMEGRAQVAEIAGFLRKHIPGFENARVSETASHVGVRETRRVYCDYTINANDIITGAEFPDGIARGNWYIDIHNPSGEGTNVQPPPEGQFYEIPFRSLQPRGIENLLIASRCLDCTHEAHAAVRITPQIVAIGQAAGAAAALCHSQGLESTRALNTDLLRETLREQGAFI